MPAIGRVASVTRYPVKSMAGEVVGRGYLNEHGLEHDRLYAFESSGAPAGMLRLTGKERREMLRYRPRVLTDSAVAVLTPSGDSYRVDSAEMLAYLRDNIAGANRILLTLEATPQTDVRPLSLLSIETVEALSSELGEAVDARRFRANLMVSMEGGAYAEDGLVERVIQIGSEARVMVRERTPRCRFVTYDPDAPEVGEPMFSMMKMLERQHQGRVGVYASVVRVGWVESGDEISVVG
ncbi:MOSC domain-containing protein [Granulicella sibirica]|uniref:Flavodoxin reductases (Ferredoxin-NADPH reductases) family 1 n=1 Tax=Granulicella sibirica TaxID=2479048 RepID=A0A4Q0T2R6_9BACT|nr:MOSC domain-containing protein [Granulicella sibirica]RXH55786.1 Flavodoxin reductases (ferredoxin-NADPH reductases) family 1 [Granulicella sibirica]